MFPTVHPSLASLKLGCIIPCIVPRAACLVCCFLCGHPSFGRLESTCTAMQAVGASERVFQLMDRKPTMAPGGPQKPVGAAEGGEIEFQDVWCVSRYSGRGLACAS